MASDLRNWQAVPLPGVLMVFPLAIKRLGVRSIEGTDFNPVPLPQLMHLKESMAPVLDAFGMELMEVREHDFREPLREAGPISDVRGVISPKLMAQNAVAAITVSINGAETGTTRNYKKVKTWIDGIGATITHSALTITGQILAKFGYHMVAVATEGTASHSKPGESAIGNPTIPIGNMYPANLSHEKYPVGPSGKVFAYSGSSPIFVGMDVVEGTEVASITVEGFQEISGRAGKPKDNGAVCVISAYDEAAVLADTYANKIIVSPAIARALRDAGVRLSLEDSLEETLGKISQATERPVAGLGVMGLGLKPRLDAKADPPAIKNERPGRKVLLDELARLGVNRTLTFDDGETPAIGVMAKNSKVIFDNGEEGTVDVMLGPGGVFETVTAARTIADACETGCGEYAAVWGYVSKEKSKRAAQYFDMHHIPEAEMGPYRELGIDPQGTRSVSETLPDNGDRIFVVSSITTNPRLNPYAVAPEVDSESNTITVYQEMVSSDGRVSGRYLTFRAKTGLSSVKQTLSPILPDIMRIDDLETLKGTLQNLRSAPAAMEALKVNLRMYLYSLVEDSHDPDRAPYYLLMNQLLLRRVVSTLDDRKALEVLEFAAREHPDWFVNPQAVADSKQIIQTGRFEVTRNEESIPIAIRVLDPDALKPAGTK
jgi:fructose-1,6-bisphosphatase/sedoheptulose 1,7-bisphosphatase-like protein